MRRHDYTTWCLMIPILCFTAAPPLLILITILSSRQEIGASFEGLLEGLQAALILFAWFGPILGYFLAAVAWLKNPDGKRLAVLGLAMNLALIAAGDLWRFYDSALGAQKKGRRDRAVLALVKKAFPAKEAGIRIAASRPVKPATVRRTTAKNKPPKKRVTWASLVSR